MPTVRVLRPFAHGHHDRIVRAGDLIEVDPDRARDLAGNDLIEMAAPPPVTKPETPPPNKAKPAPVTKPGRKPVRGAGGDS